MRRIAIATALMVLGMLNLKAQDSREVWTAAELDFRITKPLSISVDQQFRFVDSTGLKAAISQLSIKQRLTKDWDFQVTYRFTNSPIKSNSNRLMLNLMFKDDLFNSDFNFSYRLRYQYEKGIEGQNPDHDIRNKVGVDYNLSRLVDPGLDYEIFLRADNSPNFNKHRVTFFLEWKLLNNLDLETFYRFQTQLGKNSPDSQYIFGLGLNYNIDFRKD